MGKILLYDPEKRFAGLEWALSAGDAADYRALHTFTDKDQLMFYLEEVNEDAEILIVDLVHQKERGQGLPEPVKRRFII